MSESINNREYRKEVLKQVIKQLHEGKSVEEVKEQFEVAFTGVSATEISEAEGALIAEGLPVTEIQRLCDVHASVFKGSIEEIHQPTDQTQIPGHPANTLIRENKEIDRIIEKQIRPYLNDLDSADSKTALTNGLQLLSKIHLHYLRKENLLFPYMEQYGITAPPKVMWGVDDEIREQLKEVVSELTTSIKDHTAWVQKVEALLERVTEMIFKEENILIPMLIETLTQDEWKSIADESGEIGFLIDNVPTWNPAKEYKEALKEELKEERNDSGLITMPSGVFKLEELVCMLNTLPFDITFVDRNGIVKYFSQGAERIFPRTKAIIGREVSNCHPPASVHIVEKIVEDLKEGRKDHEDFWIKMMDKYILIRYYAVRDKDNQFLGVLEVSQDIKPIQEITGEKRLLSEQ
ncbi:MAG TPA: DUF438 domain-containing protein [Lachnospiraceae bacterium]|nr:DUF438 domain-containing protein [Lachnospiraceae bacterium]